MNLPLPELQRRVETARGVAYLDMAWPELHRFAEFDGEVKLFDPRYARGQSVTAIRAAQADRRTAVEEATGWIGMHWGWKQIENASTLWASMREQDWPARTRL